MTHHDDARFMRLALALANLAAKSGEAPVGCVITRNGRVIAAGYNRRETEQNALRHAELDAISAACRRLGRWRLDGCTLYVSLEPCVMCAGAIAQSRISRLVFAADDPKAGGCGGMTDIFALPGMRRPETARLCETAAQRQLASFFRSIRMRRLTNEH